MSLLLFYDAPTPPAGIFDDFLAIPSLSKDVGTRDFLSLVQSSPSETTAGLRYVWCKNQNHRALINHFAVAVFITAFLF